MSRKYERILRSRNIVVGLLLLSVGMCLAQLTGRSRAYAVGLTMYEADHGRFPRSKSKYSSEGGTSFPTSPVPIEMVSMDLTGPVKPEQSRLLPPLGSSVQIDSAFDVFTDLSIGGGGGGGGFAIDSFFDITYRVIGADGGGGGGGGGSWPIELVQLNLQGNSPIGPVMIRESETQASTGHYTLTPFSGPPSGYFIDSFFDVFTELSIDGGFTWHQASGPFRMNLVAVTPEPSSALMVIVCAGWALAMRRRPS